MRLRPRPSEHLRAAAAGHAPVEQEQFGPPVLLAALAEVADSGVTTRQADAGRVGMHVVQGALGQQAMLLGIIDEQDRSI